MGSTSPFIWGWYLIHFSTWEKKKNLVRRKNTKVVDSEVKRRVRLWKSYQGTALLSFTTTALSGWSGGMTVGASVAAAALLSPFVSAGGLVTLTSS